MNMSGPVLSLSSVFMKWPRDTLLFLCYTGCFCEVSEAHLFIFPSILFQPSLNEGSSFFFVALYELLWKWKNRWSFIAILKKTYQGEMVDEEVFAWITRESIYWHLLYEVHYSDMHHLP